MRCWMVKFKKPIYDCECESLGPSHLRQHGPSRCRTYLWPMTARNAFVSMNVVCLAGSVTYPCA